MKDDYTTNSHYLTYTLIFKRLGEGNFVKLLDVRELNEAFSRAPHSTLFTEVESRYSFEEVVVGRLKPL